MGSAIGGWPESAPAAEPRPMNAVARAADRREAVEWPLACLRRWGATAEPAGICPRILCCGGYSRSGLLLTDPLAGVSESGS